MSDSPDKRRKDAITAGDYVQTGQPSGQLTLYVFIIAIAFALHLLQWAILPFVIAGLIAFIMTPAVDWLAFRLHCPRPIAVAGVYLILLAIAAIAVFLAAPPLYSEGQHLIGDFPQILKKLIGNAVAGHTVKVMGQSLTGDQIAQEAISRIGQWVGHASLIATVSAAAYAVAFGTILVLVLLFYFLLNGPNLIHGVLWLAPIRHKAAVQKILSALNPVLQRYILGMIAVVIYAMAAAYIGLGLVLGIKHALVLAILTGLLEVIPVAGPALAVLVGATAAVRHAAGIGAVIDFAIYAILLRLSIDQFFGPILLGSAARLHPAVVIFCFLTGGVLFGIAGLILSVPAALAIRVTVRVLREE